jgi:phosphoglycolate phosphatase-like HAD superfamily hydrolase
MRLIVFDIDGTLTDTMEEDTAAFLRSFDEVFGFKNVNSEWSCYRNPTDAGIFREVFESRAGRAPSAGEARKFVDHFVELLRSGAEGRPYAAIPGAPELLVQLTQSPNYQIALATGCWSESARIKMTSAGMSYGDYPSASADDAAEREVIIELAIERATRSVDQQIAGAVYVGDGIWDAHACAKFGIPFIGIGAASQIEKLIAAGAVDVLPNLSDGERFLTVVNKVAAGLCGLPHQPVVVS